MNYTCTLILGYSNGVPEEASEAEMIMLSSGFEHHDDASTIPAEECSYMTTFAHKSKNTESALKEIKETWAEWTRQEISLEVVTTDITEMTKDQRKAFQQLDNGEWSYRLHFVVFCRGNDVALEEAKAFIIECSTRKRWKFWQ